MRRWTIQDVANWVRQNNEGVSFERIAKRLGLTRVRLHRVMEREVARVTVVAR